MAKEGTQSPGQWEIDVAFGGSTEEDRWWRQLPAARGVYALLDESGGCLCLATTANVRRMARSRLGERPDGGGPTRRVDYGRLTRRVLALAAGSGLEAEWAYLQQARVMLPQTYHTLFDRWCAWFVHCDAGAEHPRWMKVRVPLVDGEMPRGGAGGLFGPIADKHAAARYIEMVEDVFDLCRYHHILVQAPRGAACAYKEMGRCPAPCDGTVSMESYRGQVESSIEFAARGFEHWQGEQMSVMRSAGAAMDYDAAAMVQQRVKRAADAYKGAFEHVRPLEALRWISLQRGSRQGFVRVLAVAGGDVTYICELSNEEPEHTQLDSLRDAASRALEMEMDFSQRGMENLTFVCDRVMLGSGRKRDGASGRFVAVGRDTDEKPLHDAFRALAREARKVAASEHEPIDGEGDLELLQE